MRNLEKITKKQQEILDFMKQEIISRGFPPSVREICTAVNLKSTSSVHAHLETLEKKGYIRRDPDKPRAIEILDGFHAKRMAELTSQEAPDWHNSSELVNVPVLGTVAAGEPLLAVEDVDTYFPVPVNRLPNAESFFLQIKGESMINVGILNGDYVLVEKTEVARNGEKIVALIDDSATVKTFYKEDGYIRLQPENDFMEPIIVKDHLTILGRVFGVFRFLR